MPKMATSSQNHNKILHLPMEALHSINVRKVYFSQDITILQKVVILLVSISDQIIAMLADILNYKMAPRYTNDIRMHHA